jgi:hypothetical protein
MPLFIFLPFPFFFVVPVTQQRNILDKEDCSKHKKKLLEPSATPDINRRSSNSIHSPPNTYFSTKKEQTDRSNQTNKQYLAGKMCKIYKNIYECGHEVWYDVVLCGSMQNTFEEVREERPEMAKDCEYLRVSHANKRGSCWLCM